MKKIVVKIGSSVIAPEGKLDVTVMRTILKDIVNLDNKGVKSVIVTSGAIACGMNRMRVSKRPNDIHSLQAYASLGQAILMGYYTKILNRYGKNCAQVLLTWDDFNDRKRFLNSRYTITKLLNWNIIPIVNENDVVSFEEIKFGDNDKLSALVSDLIRADLLIILSDVDGLYSSEGIVKVVEDINSKIISLAKKEDKVYTTGGMVTKLEAAKIATSSGIRTVIANGRRKGVISKIVRGDEVGTVFIPASKIEKAKRRWIAFGKRTKGKIYIDDGAKQAILEKGKSLLACGITKVDGIFSKNDAVEVVDSYGKLLGVGLVEYSSSELTDVKKRRFEREVIHRDNFVKKEAT